MANHEFDLDEFCDFLEGRAFATRGMMGETTELAAERLFVEAKGLYGEHPPLAELADATKAERAKIPGISTDEPLYRTGALLRDKVEKKALPVERQRKLDVATGAAGSPEIINLYHETGYINARTGRPVPERPVFMLTGQEMQESLAEIISEELGRIFSA